MMLYSEKVKAFTAAHPCEEITVGGARYRYILEGEADGKTLVFLNGGMNTLEMWMHNPQFSECSERIDIWSASLPN